MAPYDNLPHFRRWLERKIGHTSKTRNDMLILGDFIRYRLGEAQHGGAITFQLNYRDESWKMTIAMAPSDRVYLRDELVVELTDDAISSIIAQCAFNEGSVLNERNKQGT